MMATAKIRKTPTLDPSQEHNSSDWHSAARQSGRDDVRIGWARHILDEENRHPLTHSSARIRRAKYIVAVLQNDVR